MTARSVSPGCDGVCDNLGCSEDCGGPAHPCGHEERQPSCGGCDPGAIEFVIDDATGRMTQFCCMERDQYGECGHVQPPPSKDRSVADGTPEVEDA